jgi:methyl-accepting chemotaxis protein
MFDLRRFSIRKRLIVSTVAMLAILAVSALASFGMLRFVSDKYSTLAAKQFEILSLVGDMRHTMGMLRRHEKDVFINMDNEKSMAEHFALWRSTRARIDEHMTAMGALVATEEGRVMLAAYREQMAAYFTAADPVMKRVTEGGLDSPMAANRMMERAREPFHGAEKALDESGNSLRTALVAGKAKISHAADLAGFSVLGILAVGLVFGTVGSVVMIRSITLPLRSGVALAERVATGDLSAHVDVQGRDEVSALMRALATMNTALTTMVGSVRDTSEQISVASAEVAQGNADLSVRTEQTASSLQQTASSVQQLSGTVRQTADAASQAKSLASSAAGVAGQGGEVVSRVVETMNGIQASSRKIADIIGTIDGIAFQTNILALNAAVEAARAGEQGRGFAVVASEVRGLAQRSADAAREIKALIGASVEKVESGSRLVGDAGQTMNEIVASVQRVAHIIGEISSATHEQSEGIAQVNGSVGSLDGMTQQNAALVEQSAAAAESLRLQAQRLAAAVGSFKLASTNA